MIDVDIGTCTDIDAKSVITRIVSQGNKIVGDHVSLGSSAAGIVPIDSISVRYSGEIVTGDLGCVVTI